MDWLRDILGAPVRELRTLLTESLSVRLGADFGVVPRTGERRPVSELTLGPAEVAARERILDVLDHHEACGLKPPEAVERFVREAAFTHLNRLVALRMLEDESRRVITGCVAGGREAPAFKLFRRVAPEISGSRPDEGLAVLLELLFDELALEVGELFDTGDPRVLLEPAAKALQQAIDRLNDPELQPAFREDETIGWVYQLFTTAKEREDSREEHKSGPPTAEHLAFRNQFYTPRWVVEFLAQNTLGQLLVERSPEAARLRETLEFLLPSGPWPATPPRELSSIKVLDPACGSGHFLVYCFDLLAAAYEAQGVERDRIPGLVIGQNLFGIEIDRRAAQLAALALYLHAKRYAPRAAVPPANIIVAEPIADDPEMLAELVERLEDPQAEQLVRGLRKELSNADRIGCLYPMRHVLGRMLGGGAPDARKGKKGVKKAALPQLTLPIVDFERWTQRLLETLEELAEEAASAGPGRRLSLAEQQHDLALVRALLTTYDVVLMNPPFGAPVPSTKEKLKGWYPRAGDKTNLYAACVEQGLSLLRPGGYLGAITDRSGFFITTFQEFREEVALGMADVVAFADLGFGILGGADEPAKVEAAGYALRRKDAPA